MFVYLNSLEIIMKFPINLFRISIVLTKFYRYSVVFGQVMMYCIFKYRMSSVKSVKC
jgi:hypothetical protein